MITVLSVSYALAPVALDAVGGAEVVLAQIDRALVARGHRSMVVAPHGSSVAGELFATTPIRGPIDQAARERATADAMRAIRAALSHAPIDVVHFHGLDHPVLREAARGTTMLATLHLPIEQYPRAALEAPDVVLACVSASQAATLPAALRRRAHVIENGVDLARFRPRGGRREQVLALGRICPEKNYGDAIAAARLAGTTLVIAGQVHRYALHERYFREVVAPSIGRGVVLAGPVAGERKAQLLASARCLLVPSTVRETSSLVAMEATASGTPVVAYPAGALADLVDDGCTGFLVHDVAGMARAIAASASIDPRACRARAEARFDLARSCDRWVALLEQLAGAREPCTRPEPAAAHEAAHAR